METQGGDQAVQGIKLFRGSRVQGSEVPGFKVQKGSGVLSIRPNARTNELLNHLNPGTLEP
jgi:hypothetical protein